MPLLGAGLANIKSGRRPKAYVDSTDLINWDNSVAMPKEWLETDTNKGSFRTGGNLSTNKTTIASPFPVTSLIGTDFTISCWVKIAEMPTIELCIVNLRHTNSEGIALLVEANTGVLTCQFKDASSDKTISSGINIVDNEWHHIAFSHDNSGNYQRIYIDGYSIGVASNTMNFTETNGTLTIGVDPTKSTSYANSYIKSLAFWERLLLDESIRSIMYEVDSTKWVDLFSGNELTDLIAYFILEDNANCSINASYNGTIQNTNTIDFIPYERPHKPRLQSIPLEGKEPTYAFLNTGRAVVFDGVMDHFVSPELWNPQTSSIAPTRRKTNQGTAITFLTYIYFDDFDFRYGIMSYGDFGFDMKDSKTITYYSKSNGGTGVASTDINLYVDLVPKTWYRLCITVEDKISGGLTIDLGVYINGAVNTIQNSAMDVSNASKEPTMIGWRDGPSDEYSNKAAKFRGQLCDVQIWLKRLDPNDIIYDSINPEKLAWEREGTSLASSDLLHHYTFTDGSFGEFSSVHDQASGNGKIFGELLNCKETPPSDLFRGNVYGVPLDHNGTIYNAGKFASCPTFESLIVDSNNFLKFDSIDIPTNAKNEGAIGSFHYKTDATNFRMQLTSPTAYHYQDTGYIISKPFSVNKTGNIRYLLTLDLKIISGDFYVWIYGDNINTDWTSEISWSSAGGSSFEGKLKFSTPIYDFLGANNSSRYHTGPILTEGSTNPQDYGGPEDGYVNGTWVRRSYDIHVRKDFLYDDEICFAFTGINGCEAKFTNIKLEEIGDCVDLTTSEFSGQNLHSTGVSVASHWTTTGTADESRTDITPEYGPNFLKLVSGNRQADDGDDEIPGSPFWGKLPGTIAGGFSTNLNTENKHMVIEAFILPEGNGDLISNGTKVPFHTTEYEEPTKIGASSAIGSGYRNDISTTFENSTSIVAYYGNGLDTQFMGWDEVGDINSTVETTNQLAGTRCPKLATDGSGDRSMLCQTVGGRIDSEQGMLIYRFWIKGDGSNSLEWKLYHKPTLQGTNGTGPPFAEYTEIIPSTSFGYTTATWKEVYLVFDKKNPVFNNYPAGMNTGHRYLLAIKSPAAASSFGYIDLMNMYRSATLKYSSIDLNSTNQLTFNVNSENTTDEQLHRDPNCYDLNDYTENNGCVLTYHGTSTRIKADFVNSNSSFTTDPLAVNSGDPEAVYPGSRYCVWLKWRQEGDGSAGGGAGGNYKLGVTFNNPDGTSTRKVHEYTWVSAGTYNEVNLFFDNDAYSENATIEIDADGDPYTGTHLVNFKNIKVYIMYTFGIRSINLYEPGSSFDFANGSNIRHVPQLALQPFNASYKFSGNTAKNFFKVGANGLTTRELDTTMSISFWIRISHVSEETTLLSGFFYNKNGDGINSVAIAPCFNGGYAIRVEASATDAVYTSTDVSSSVKGGLPITQKWAHIVINKNTNGGNWDDDCITWASGGTPFSIYVDGKNVGIFDGGSGIVTEGTTIGARYASSTPAGFFNGELRDLATYNTKLTTQDIHDLREGGKPCDIDKYIEKGASHLWQNIDSIQNFIATSLTIEDAITNSTNYQLYLIDPVADQDPSISLRNSNSFEGYDDGGFKIASYNSQNTSTYRMPPSSGYSISSFPNLIFNRSPFYDHKAGNSMESMGVDFWIKFSRTISERISEVGNTAIYAPIIQTVKGTGTYAYLKQNFEVTIWQYITNDYLMIRYWDDTFQDANATRAVYTLQDLPNPINHLGENIGVQSVAGTNPSRGINSPWESKRWYHFHIGIDSNSIGPDNDNYLGYSLYQPIFLFVNGINVLKQGISDAFGVLTSAKEIGNENTHSTIGRGVKSLYTGGDVIDTTSTKNIDIEVSSLKVYNAFDKHTNYERAAKNYRAERRKH